MKVFLSSTYIDLIEYRKAAKDALERLGQQVGEMEIFGARDEEPKKVALSEIEKCQLVIGVYAHRYGSILEGDELSITEHEFLHAKEKRIPVFCFVVDEDQPWPPKMMEKDANKIKKLEEFKAKILKEKTIEFFTTPDNLAKKIMAAVHNHFEELKAAEEAARQREVAVNVNGNFSGNLIVGDSNAANSASQIVNYQHSKPTGNTLPSQPYFFGRADELKTIAAALSHESRTWGALIDGPGGIGKTALAIKAAHDAPAELFERKIFITAKVRELTPEGEKQLRDFSRDNYVRMLDELGKELGADGLEKLAPDERPNELRLALAGKKALIIFDNLETLPEDERTRLFQFLSRLPEGNKAIVTSRRRTDVDARIVRLDRLARDEALQLITELAAKYPRLDRASQKEREELYEIAQGNPLFIRWIAGQLGRDGSQCRIIAEACAFIDKAPKGNDPLEYIFGDLLETFTADETKVLAALTYFSLPAKLKWIAEMTDLPTRAAETALEDLTDRSILTSDLSAQTYFLPPLTAKFIRTRRPEAVTQTGDALVKRAFALSLQYGGHTNYEGFKTLDAEWDFLAAALPRLLMSDNNPIQMVCDLIDQFLNYTGRWDEAVWLAEQTEVLALNSGNKNTAGWRAYQAGWIYFMRDQPDKVLECAKRASLHWDKSSPREKGAAIRLRGLGHKIQEDYPAALANYREALEIWRTISPESDDVTNVLNDIAIIERINEDYAAAERNYQEILRIDKKNNNQEGIPVVIGNLANVAIERKQWAEAESLAREALALAEKVGRHELIAHDCNYIAIALLKQNQNLEEALSMSHRAVEIFTHLRSGGLQSAQETLAEIEKKINGE